MQAVSSRRNSELSLLLISFIIGSGALALVALAKNPNKVGGAIPLMMIITSAYVAAHFVVRKKAAQSDPVILPVTATLNVLGLAAIYRLSPKELGPTQVTWAAVGIACFIATVWLVKDYRRLASYKYIFGFAGVGLLLLPVTPLGTTINGARLWLRLGPFTFQPGEISKICLVIFFAAYLAERKELLSIASRKVLWFHMPDIKHFGPLLVMWGVSLAVMFFEKDLGSSLLFFAIFLVMIYIATARLVYMLIGFGLFAVGAYVGYQTFSHVQVRVSTWLNVFDPKFISDEGYQLAQSLFALSTGGLFGTGFGQGRPDLIPAASTDFIFSALGEELGLLGTAAVLVGFMLLVARGLRVAVQSRDDFGQLLGSGLTIILGLQTIIILAGVTRMLPLTGITLPFMSYGGSSMLSNFILIGLLIRISHQTTDEPTPAMTSEILIGGRG